MSMMEFMTQESRVNDILTAHYYCFRQTLDRTLMTSATTVLVLVALFFLGGDIIHNFALALIIGIVVGTYSSIYVAANLLLMLGICREDLLPPEVEEEESVP